MIEAPETVMVETTRVKCDGADAIRAGDGYRPSALGHPRVWLEIDEKGYVECGYCDRRFVLKGGPLEATDTGAPPSRPDPSTATDTGS